jgi:hypothetical protein
MSPDTNTHSAKNCPSSLVFKFQVLTIVLPVMPGVPWCQAAKYSGSFGEVVLPCSFIFGSFLFIVAGA